MDHDVVSAIKATSANIEKLLSLTGTPSLSYAVIHRGQTVCTAHKGFRDVKSGTAPDDQTHYNINSLTKATVAALVGIEVDRGSLAWDSKIKDFLPKFRSLSLTVQEQATIIDFLSHRTGITSCDAPWLQSKNTILMERDQILPFFATLKPIQEFRTFFFYNNWGYEIVGLILEKVSGLPLAELLRVNLFEPLGMHCTSTSWQTDDDNVAKSYCVRDGEQALAWSYTTMEMLVEAVLGVPELNDYIHLAKELINRSLHHISDISAELTKRRKLGTQPRALKQYAGTYWNSASNFRIDIDEDGDDLRLKFQRHPDGIYVLRHYRDDVFEWLMPHNEVVRRGRYVSDFGADFYLIRFYFRHLMEGHERSSNGFSWAWDPATPGDPEYFHAWRRDGSFDGENIRELLSNDA